MTGSNLHHICDRVLDFVQHLAFDLGCCCRSHVRARHELRCDAALVSHYDRRPHGVIYLVPADFFLYSAHLADPRRQLFGLTGCLRRGDGPRFLNCYVLRTIPSIPRWSVPNHFGPPCGPLAADFFETLSLEPDSCLNLGLLVPRSSPWRVHSSSSRWPRLSLTASCSNSLHTCVP